MLYYLITVTMPQREINFLMADISKKDTLTKFNFSTHGHFEQCFIKISPLSVTEYFMLNDSLVITYYYGKYETVDCWDIIRQYPRMEYTHNTWKQMILQ